MTRIEFDQMVEDLERCYKDRAGILTKSALTWALMGYLALFLGLVGSLAVVAACLAMVIAAPNALTIKLAFVFVLAGLLIAVSILRGIWIRCGVPEGETIRAEEAPELFKLIGDTSNAAGGVPLARVLITPDLNACVVQSPRLGIFGWHRNYLCLGIQMMDLLAPEEFHAVLAHEFAHLSKSHGRTGNWIYRIRRSWENVAESLAAQGGVLVRPLASFFGWFWPRFNARAFVLSRAHEYEADAFAARVTSPDVAVAALTRVAMESLRLDEELWGKMGQRTTEEPEPPAALFDEIAALARARVETETATRWLTRQFARITDTSDTHPSLRDRVTALGGAPGGPPPVIAESASTRFLGNETAAGLRATFSKTWREFHATLWKESSSKSRADREKLERISAKEEDAPTPWEVLHLKLEVNGVPAIRQDLAAFVESNPDHHEARYILGSHLLSVDDPAGLELLEQVAGKMPSHAIACFGEIAAYHDRRGDAGAIRDLKRRADEHEALLERALHERHFLTKRDPFIPHGLTPDEVQAITRFLESIPELSAASMARKDAKEFPEWKSYVLIVRFSFGAFQFVTQSRIEGLLQRVVDGVKVDGYIVVLNDKAENKPVAKRLRAVEGTEIFKRRV